MLNKILLQYQLHVIIMTIRFIFINFEVNGAER